MFFGAIAALSLLASPGSAQTILYTYTGTLNLNSGSDVMLLNGSTAVISFDVPASATYMSRFGLPEVPVVNPTLTLSGSGNAANNGTFSIESSAFYPSFAGFFTEPGGVNQSVLLGGGDTLRIAGNTNPTASGAAALIGGQVSLADFGPATASSVFTDITASTSYTIRANITAQLVSPVPEPGPAALIASVTMSGAGILFLRRRTGLRRR
jgi:hypothetical protein